MKKGSSGSSAAATGAGLSVASTLVKGSGARAADTLDRKRHAHLTGALERQRYRDLLAFRERCGKTDQHQMPPARLKFHRLAGFNEQASVDRTHGHNALVERHFVNLDFLGGIGRGGQQTIGLRSLVLDGQIATRNLGAARRGTAPGLRDGEIARRDLSGMNGRCKQPPAGDTTSQPDCSISHDNFSDAQV